MSTRKQPRVSNKVLIAPAILFIAVLLFVLVILNNAGLIFFNVLFGRPVYAVETTYNLAPYYYSGATLVKVTFNYQLIKVKQPIETILHQTTVQVVGENPQLDVNSLNFIFNIPVHIYTGLPQHQIGLYDGTFTYNDNKLRTITIYLPNFDPNGNSEQQEVYVEIHGSYTINGQTLTYESGTVLKVEL